MQHSRVQFSARLQCVSLLYCVLCTRIWLLGRELGLLPCTLILTLISDYRCLSALSTLEGTAVRIPEYVYRTVPSQCHLQVEQISTGHANAAKLSALSLFSYFALSGSQAWGLWLKTGVCWSAVGSRLHSRLFALLWPQ